MIRDMKLKDFKEVNIIFKEVHKLHTTNCDFFNDVDPCPKTTFKELLHKENSINLVSENNGHIDGILFSTIEERKGPVAKEMKVLHINTLGVKEEHHQKGIGKALINEAKTRSQKLNLDKIILGVWMFNKNALAFYKHLGFEEMSLKMNLNLK